MSRLSARFPVLKWRSRPLAKSLYYNSRDTETLIILKTSRKMKFSIRKIRYTVIEVLANFLAGKFQWLCSIERFAFRSSSKMSPTSQRQNNTTLSCLLLQCFSYRSSLHVVAETMRLGSTISRYLNNRQKNPCYCSCYQYETLLPSYLSSSSSLKLTAFELVNHYIIY